MSVLSRPKLFLSKNEICCNTMQIPIGECLMHSAKLTEWCVVSEISFGDDIVSDGIVVYLHDRTPVVLNPPFVFLAIRGGDII